MNSFIILITGILGAILTYYVNHNLKQGAVRASALLSLIVALFFYVFPNMLSTYLTINIPLVFIGTSFIGMVSLKINYSFVIMAIAGFLFSVLYLQKNNLFNGYGGALGALALIALVIVLGTAIIFKKYKSE